MYFFFNDTATTEIYTLSLHDALPILGWMALGASGQVVAQVAVLAVLARLVPPRDHGLVAAALIVVNLSTVLAESGIDRKSTRLNSSHANISYAVFCLKKKILFSTLRT